MDYFSTVLALPPFDLFVRYESVGLFSPLPSEGLQIRYFALPDIPVGAMTLIPVSVVP
jgi:hypothetical protein